MIRCQLRLQSMPHAYAVVRAAENALGSSVISIDVRRDQDSLRMFSVIHISTLRPVEFSKPLHLSIPFPKIEDGTENGEVDPYGGPSLRDIAAALDTAPRELETGEAGLSFKIEKMVNKPQRSSWTPGYQRSRAAWENGEMLDALEEMGGKWAQLSRMWAHLPRPAPRAQVGRTSEDGSVTEIINDTGAGAGAGAGTGDDLESMSALERAHAHSEKRRAKYSRRGHGGDMHDTISDVLDGVEDDLDQLRRHSHKVREERHKRRLAAQNADPSLSADLPTDGWTFEIGSDDNKPTLDELKIAPEVDRPAFSIKSHVPKPAPRTTPELVGTEVALLPDGTSTTARSSTKAKKAAQSQTKGKSTKEAKLEAMRQMALRDLKAAKEAEEKRKRDEEEQKRRKEEEEAEKAAAAARAEQAQRESIFSRRAKAESEGEVGQNKPGQKSADEGSSFYRKLFGR